MDVNTHLVDVMTHVIALGGGGGGRQSGQATLELIALIDRSCIHIVIIIAMGSRCQ